MQAPSGELDREECVLICNPFGQEAIRCHRLLKVLADRLARSGFHVMRFDYFGTGDSDGDDTDGDLASWIGDVCNADHELRERSRCARSSWFGLRLGASVAAMASSRFTDAPQRLVLWDPIIYGTEYLDEIVAANAAAGQENYGARWLSEGRLREMVAREAVSAALGFLLGPVLREQLRAISPNDFTGIRAARITILNARTPEYLNELSRMLAARAVDINLRPVSSDIVWASNEAMNSAIVPADILQEIVAAFADRR